MDYEFNFEAESFNYEGDLEGYEGVELEGYEAEYEGEYGSSADYEFEENKQDALDLNNPQVARALQNALSRATGVRLPASGVIGPQAAGLLRAIQRRNRIKPNGVVGRNTLQALRRDAGANVASPEAESEFEWEGEVSRKSSTYIRWVQQSLNQLQGSGLAVDGANGPKTKAAVRQFQQRRGLTADGIVGPQTEAALVAAGAPAPPQVSTPTTSNQINSQLPVSGPGFYCYSPASRRYGIAETIRALQQIGATWASSAPAGPRIGVGDISLQGGGPISGHASHQRGVDVDLRLMRNDGREEPTVYQSAQYSRPLTQRLINIIRANGVLRVQYIFFNDPQATGVSPWPNHDNHLHVRFYNP